MNIAALLAGLFSGIIGSMGMGGGAVLIIYLMIFTSTKQLNAQGINLIFFIPIGIISIIIYAIKKQIEWKTTAFISVFGLLGSGLGLLLTEIIDTKYISYIFGAFLIFLGLKEIFSKKCDNSIDKVLKK